jgi:LDH2 family malate/lactate/ureidoglycolate dehydrogenase
MPDRYHHEALRAFAVALLERSGLAAAMARDVADILVEGDLLGHDTHGLALLAGYLGELDKGTMTKGGTYEVVNERAACATWDGRRLPGPWLTLRAVEKAIAMARACGTGTVAIRRSHHIACLAAYLKRATDQGLMIVLACSDPNTASVAPFGGTRAVFTPNPLALGFPTAGEPVLVDISASLTTNGMTNRLHRQGKRLAHEWLIDAEGRASADPAVLFTQPPGTILPLGGLHAGHKGYGLALLVDSLPAVSPASGARIRRKAGVPQSTSRCSIPRPSDRATSSNARWKRLLRPAAPTRRVRGSIACACQANAVLRAAASNCATASP